MVNVHVVMIQSIAVTEESTYNIHVHLYHNAWVDERSHYEPKHCIMAVGRRRED